MAKKSNSTKYEKVTINVDDMTLTEFIKDNNKTHNILDVLREWHGVDNIVVTFAKNSEV